MFRFRILIAVAAVLPGMAASAQTLLEFNVPSDDRWHYPFNASPGNRSRGSLFSSVGDLGPNGQPRFNDRDGVVILAWDTSGALGGDPQFVQSVRVVVTSDGGIGADWPIDLTVDAWYTFDRDADGFINPDGIPRGEPGDTDGESDDEDPGRPLELYGAAFGDNPFFDENTWIETSFFLGWNQQSEPVARDPFPFTYQDGTLDILHLEDHIKGLHNESLAVPLCDDPDGICPFTATPWAIGEPIGYTPGNQPDPFEIVFEVNLDLKCGAVRDYFQGQFENGRVIVTLSTLLETTEMAATGFPSLFLNNPQGNPHPARLEIVVADAPVSPADLNRDGVRDATDVQLFADVLTGVEQDATLQVRADLNCDLKADGHDIQPFVQEFVQ